jgi:hypothetical protein
MASCGAFHTLIVVRVRAPTVGCCRLLPASHDAYVWMCVRASDLSDAWMCGRPFAAVIPPDFPRRIMYVCVHVRRRELVALVKG